MLKREFKVNLKSFIIWTLIMVITFTVVFLVYPSIVENSKEALDTMMLSMPSEMLSMFNMDKVSITSVFGWLVTEGYMMITLVVSCYSAILGSTVLVREIDDKTIEYLYSKPISRNKIYINKIIPSISYIVLINIFIGLTTLIGLLGNNEFVFIKWLLLTLLPLLLHLFIFFFSLMISNYFKKTRKSMGISLGITFMFYLLNVLGLLSDKISFLKYISPFTYIDSKYVIDGKMDYLYLIIITLSTIICILISNIKYRKQQF